MEKSAEYSRKLNEEMETEANLRMLKHDLEQLLQNHESNLLQLENQKTVNVEMRDSFKVKVP